MEAGPAQKSMTAFLERSKSSGESSGSAQETSFSALS
jgi:hypothetical protein